MWEITASKSNTASGRYPRSPLTFYFLLSPLSHAREPKEQNNPELSISSDQVVNKTLHSTGSLPLPSRYEKDNQSIVELIRSKTASKTGAAVFSAPQGDNWGVWVAGRK